ncbi:MAG: transcription antitermination factor NusB [Eubacteriales bacterium]|nr:transcription antitermination factor NusB [Eubacteriales bacterium]
MTRRKLREAIFLLLFRIEFNTREEVAEQAELYFEGVEAEEDINYIRKKTEAIYDHLTEIDEKIMEICKGWRLSRLGKVELAILRLAVYEILFDADIPTGVAINEAVELAKIYGGEEAPRFINGVLAKLA